MARKNFDPRMMQAAWNIARMLLDTQREGQPVLLASEDSGRPCSVLLRVAEDNMTTNWREHLRIVALKLLTPVFIDVRLTA